MEEEKTQQTIEENTKENALEEIIESAQNSSENIIEETIEEQNTQETTQEVTQEIVQENEEEIAEENIKQHSGKVTVRPVKFKNFDQCAINRTIKKNLDILHDVTMHVSVELGKAKSTIREVMELEKDSIVELNKVAGEQVEIYVNDKLIAQGEVIVIEDKFGVRITNTNTPIVK